MQTERQNARNGWLRAFDGKKAKEDQLRQTNDKLQKQSQQLKKEQALHQTRLKEIESKRVTT